eukprot:TRINITY_DN15371_c0_g1_i2.p1 TRINITY_DN15371_c0_g1~~TRINITY_DN15371_c0_g1_i2.p1  ORF type:complete len:249 (-),score=49.64 TRINITY_DN15371_c0_g1_i2:275-958(-)
MATEEEMPVSPSKSKSSKAAKEPAPEKPKFTWEDLEGKKARAACYMDRVEFLASTRNKFTEFRAKEAGDLGFSIRSRSQPHGLLSRQISRSTDTAAQVLLKQELALQGANTPTKRLDALNRFVIDKETRTAGKEVGDMAKQYAKSSQAMKKPYPTYDELFNLVSHEPGQPREPPLQAVSCLMNYQPPKEALRHGMSQSLTNLSVSGGSSKNASRKAKANEANEANDE